MSAVVFLGPSLPREVARLHLDAVYLPPAAQGDIYRICAGRPDWIGLVDGRFQDVPAVWHKEILWALTQGIPVVGSSSMGALRAAELDRYGMVGVGEIYRAYRDGVLEDDDEVAVAHLDHDDDYAPLSEPMVDIRHTLAAAATDGIISRAQAEFLIGRAKATFYSRRSYDLVLAHAREADFGAEVVAALAAWCRGHATKQKRSDAIELLAFIASTPAPARVPFAFEHTQFFERARRTSAAAPRLSRDAVDVDAAGEVTLDRLLGELRLQPSLYRDVRHRAVARCLATRDSARTADAAGLQSALDRFRASRGLSDPSDTRAWMAANQLTLRQLAVLAAEDAHVEDVALRLDGDLDVHLRNELRSSGEYAELARRAESKHRTLRDAGLDDASEASIDDDVALAWFCDHTGLDRPRELLPFVRGFGYADPVVFLRAVKRAYLFEQLRPDPVVSR